VGRTVLYPISVNEPIFESRLAPTTLEAGGIAAVVKPSKRVVAVKVDKIIGVAGFLYPGNRVDVLVTMAPPKSPYLTKIVLENVLILATGPTMSAGSTKKERPQQVTVVSLEVTPEEAEKLALAVNEGRISLALRNYADTEDVFTEGATIKALLSSYKKASWTPEETGTETTTAGPPIYSIELIKGNNVSRVEF
jgi:pilus assembly protein CpaB